MGGRAVETEGTNVARGGTGRSRSDGRETVLVAGAGGFLGRAISSSLVEGGYLARGLVRDPAKSESVRRVGANPVVGDLLDAAAVRRAVAECDCVIQVAAAYPGPGVPPDRPRSVRVDGTRLLAQEARAAGVHRLILGSGYWVYADHPGVLHDDSPLDPRGESRLNFDAERAALAFAHPGEFEVVIVRPGMVYGDGSWFRGMVDSLRAGTYRYPGQGDNYWSLVALSDAAHAFRTLVDAGQSGEAYLVVDDHPITTRELSTLVARELGVATPSGVPFGELRSAVGDDVAHHLAANRAGSNQRLRHLGWSPLTPDARIGVPRLVRSMGPG